MDPSLIPTIEDIESRAFWLGLCRNLTIENPDSVAPQCVFNDIGKVSQYFSIEGYFNVPSVLPLANVVRLRDAIKQLYDIGLPAAFAFVYDDFWLLFQALRPLLSSLLDPSYRMLPAFWAWYINPSTEAAGWPPHRDRAGQATRGPDGTPYSISVWIPLSEATPLNGCMYLVPQHLDRVLRANYNPGENDPKEAPFSLQDIRAVPATAGSVLGWHQQLLHWGGRASKFASSARCSVSIEFQCGERSPFETPLLDPQVLLPFERRLGMIGHLARQYWHFSGQDSANLQNIFFSLEKRFYH